MFAVASHRKLMVNTPERGPEPQRSRPGQAVDPPADLRVDVARTAPDECRRDASWRHTRVAVAAYYIAERRGFQPGSEAADWRLAERQIDAADETYG
jgi:hypothetical protein